MTAWDIALIVGAFVLILVGAEVFTNGVEWLGIKLRISEGATGSILAAFGTATPETLIPVIAILFTNSADSDEIGVGAILGAPFMLAILVMYTAAIALALLPKELHPIKGVVGWVFLPAYGLYLYLVLRTPRRSAEDVEEATEEREAFGDLTFAAYLRRVGASVVPTAPPMWL